MVRPTRRKAGAEIFEVLAAVGRVLRERHEADMGGCRMPGAGHVTSRIRNLAFRPKRGRRVVHGQATVRIRMAWAAFALTEGNRAGMPVGYSSRDEFPGGVLREVLVRKDHETAAYVASKVAPPANAAVGCAARQGVRSASVCSMRRSGMSHTTATSTYSAQASHGLTNESGMAAA